MASSKLDALLERLEVTEEDIQKIKEETQGAKSDVNIFVAGKIGTGKSRLVNALAGAMVAPEGDDIEPQTSAVENYKAQCEGGYTIHALDSPGLFDGSGGEDEYMQGIKREWSDKIDMLLYCIDMSDTRADVEEISSGMTLLTKALGQDVWTHAMIVLTFANVVDERITERCSNEDTSETADVKKLETADEKKLETADEKKLKTADEKKLEMTQATVKIKFQEKVQQWREKVNSALERAGVNFPQVPIEPAGDYRTPHLPDRIHWLGYLWLHFFHHIKEEAKLAILVTNEHRLRNYEHLQPMDPESDTFNTENISQLPLVIDSKIMIAGVCGGAAGGGVVGTAVGAVAGAAIGGAIVGGLTFGIGTIGGAVVGGVVGAAGGGYIAGGLSTALLWMILQKKQAKEIESAK